jgi:hypothetical protein
MSFRLFKYTLFSSISTKLSRNSVSVAVIWNSMLLIGIGTTAEPIKELEPILNWTMIAPLVDLLM